MKMDKLFDTVRRWTRPWTTGTEPIEIRRAVLERVEQKIVAAGSGRRIFPYNLVRVHLLAPAEQHTELEAVIQEAWDLQADIRERLAEQGSSFPPELRVEVKIDELPEGHQGEPYRIEYERAAPAAPAAAASAPGGATAASTAAPAASRPALELTVLNGTATQRVYHFTADRVTLGRLQEVVDDEGRVRRRNDVAFLEEGDVSQTVSREHARILYDARGGEFRLRSEPGAAGTRILRDGRTIDVSGHDPRGVRLQAGDEIYLGRARLKVAFREDGFES